MKTTMTNELPAEIMENGIHYTLVGDYYFPTCMLADRSPNGKWASLYERYLQEKHPHEYVRLIWADELSALLESVQKECEERVVVLVREMAEVEGVNEALKENRQMEWVQRMEMIRGRGEEVVREEMIGSGRRGMAAGTGEFLLLYSYNNCCHGKTDNRYR